MIKQYTKSAKEELKSINKLDMRGPPVEEYWQRMLAKEMEELIRYEQEE